MIFTRPMWLIGTAMAFDSMRRGFVGGSMLALFIIKEFGLEKGAVPTLNYLRSYLAVEERIIPQLPDFLSYLLTPFIDYHDSAMVYLKILDVLVEQQRRPECYIYWEEKGL